MLLGTGKCVKDQVFNLLSREWPLSARKIFYELKNGNNLTYQAVYKALQELIEKNIVKKQDQQYFVNIEWVNDTVQHLESIRQEYRYRQGFLNGQFMAKNPFCFDRRIANFIEKVGPKVQSEIKDKKAAILAICGNTFGVALKQFLGEKVSFMQIHHENPSLPKNLPDTVIVVDFYIHTGGAYKRVMKTLREHPKIKNIHYVVEYDMLGLADFTAERGQMPPPLIEH